MQIKIFYFFIFIKVQIIMNLKYVLITSKQFSPIDIVFWINIFLMIQQPQQNYQLMDILKEAVTSQPTKKDKLDQEEDKLISSESIDDHPIKSSQEAKSSKQNQVIDPFQQLILKNNVIPLLAVIDKVDLTMDLQGKPLLNRLCTMNIPLQNHLKDRQIVFKNDADNRSALHQAIAADDIISAYWCLQHKIQNNRDNYGNTPILEAIRLGRRSHFLLLLHFQYFDSQAVHRCAVYNRAWEIKVLYSLGYDVISQRDSQHFSPLERAVENYSYDVAEFLTTVTDNISIIQLKAKTDSQGIIRTIQKTIQSKSFLNSTLLPFASHTFHLVFLYYLISNVSYLKSTQNQNSSYIYLLAALYLILVLVGKACQTKVRRQKPDLLHLLGGPQFPILEMICPFCLSKQQVNHEHCRQCKKCVPRFHYHDFVCVNKYNQIFWFLIEFVWFVLLFTICKTFILESKLNNILIINFSTSSIFQFCSVIQTLFYQNHFFLLSFLYLTIFKIYQFFVCFQLFSMLVLKRSYRQINNTEKYRKLYRILQQSDGNYKSQQIRLMENGWVKGIISGLKNTVNYFFTQ